MEDFIGNATNTDVFTESLKSEDCVAILYSCRKKLEEEIKKALQMCEKAKDSQIKRRSSHPKVFLGKDALKICSKFTGEQPC